MERYDGRPPATLPRRSFLSRLSAAAAGLLTAGVATGAGTAAAQHASARPGRTLPPESWLERLDGRHGQIFDAPSLGGGKALQQVRNYLDAYRDAYGLESDAIDAVIGAHGSAVPLVFQDSVWERFGLGERFDVQDPRTGAPARRNVFARREDGGVVPPDVSIEALQQRGVIFLLCNNSLKRLTATLSQAGFGAQEAVRAELTEGLLPGVEVVPAMVVALNLAQERGLSYVYSG